MQLLKTLLAVVATTAAGTSALPTNNDNSMALYDAKTCEIPPGGICQPFDTPEHCEFCCFNFAPPAWSNCHQHEPAEACQGAGLVWHCDVHA